MTSIVDVYKTQRAGNEVMIDTERDGYDNCDSMMSNPSDTLPERYKINTSWYKMYIDHI